MKLSILIPTYNRSFDLRRNMELLSSFINQDNLEKDVCVIVSDNASTDDTMEVVKPFLSSTFHVEYYRHNENVGYSKNLLFAMSKATTEWVMLLGDDDYLEPWYIKECLKQTDEHPDLGCIIPNYIDYNTETQQYGSLREEYCKTEYYKAGFDACMKNAWRAHQLSGLCFRCANVVEVFLSKKMNNLYPQMFFVAYNALRYDVLHFGQKCLVVSTVPQVKKDWNYGDDGLINDIFENFKKLGVSYNKRAKLETFFMQKTQRYVWTTNNINLTIEEILQGKNVSYLGRYYIAKLILHDRCYTGRKLRFFFYMVARIVLLKKLVSGREISL